MMFFVGLIVGLVIGGSIGLFLAALSRSGAR